MKKILVSSVSLVALAGALTGCGGSSTTDARTQACRSWTVDGATAARSALALGAHIENDGVDTPSGTSVVNQLHDGLTRIAAIKGLSDADFKPFAAIATAAPTNVLDLDKLAPGHPDRKAMNSAMLSVGELCK